MTGKSENAAGMPICESGAKKKPQEIDIFSLYTGPDVIGGGSGLTTTFERRMKMISAFPKIFTIGDNYISSIFNDPVEITEKVDGSQFVFGRVDDILYCRSKGKVIVFDAPEKMFNLAVDYVLSIQDMVENNTIYYCEYLNKSKHNVIAYDTTPKNHLALFGISRIDKSFISSHTNLCVYADAMDIDIVPLLYSGKINNPKEIHALLDADSYLGGSKIEGVVVKNYSQPFLLGGQPIPLMAGKYVSEKFKEKHRTDWKGHHTGKGKWDLFKAGFRTDARWQKAVQHLRDNGELENNPRDIGKLIKEINRDITEEEQENIKNFLWKLFGNEVLRKSTAGFPEWYKEQLLENAF